MKKLRDLLGGVRGRVMGMLALASVFSMSFAQVTGAEVFSEFETAATGLITQWGTVAVGICGLWVVTKLAPKFIKRLTSAA